MTARIGDFVFKGELRNTRRNGVFGWIEFAPEFGIRIELTGNSTGLLQGKHIRFEGVNAKADRPPIPAELPEIVNNLADRQIGVVGELTLRKVSERPTPNEGEQRSEEPVETAASDGEFLYFEWFSQNGRVVAEIPNPTIEYITDESEPERDSIEVERGDGYDEDFPGIHLDEHGLVEHFDMEADDEEEDSEEVDPYGLFGSDLEQKVANSLDLGDSEKEPGANAAGDKKSWDEVMPDLDPETRAMYEQWDEIFEGKKDEPIAYLFETPLRLPRPERVESEEDATTYVKAILAQLARLSVALDVCEHYSPRQTYELLMNEILPTAKVHPNLAASEMVQHYSSSDFCPACDAEFSADYKGRGGTHPEEEDIGNGKSDDATDDESEDQSTDGGSES